MLKKLFSAPHPAAPPPPDGYARIELDYPIHPRPRELLNSKGGERLAEMLAASVPGARELARRITAYHRELVRIPLAPGPGVEPDSPTWLNGWFPPLDAVMLYGLLVLENPRWYVEVGSGNSTRFARRAVRDYGLRTKIFSIDPAPRADIDAICDHVVRARLEDVDVGEIVRLTGEDLLFVDSSHRSFQNSDVTVFFTELLPALPPGLLYGIHDIYLPWDYPEAWVERFYSEQYLLACYLLGGADGDTIVAPLTYLLHDTNVPALFAPTFAEAGLEPLQRNGHAFWMRRRAR